MTQNMYRAVVIVLLLVFRMTHQSCSKILTPTESLIEDMTLETITLLQKYGYTADKHEVATEDGYIIEIHRLAAPKQNRKQDTNSYNNQRKRVNEKIINQRKPKKLPVILMHGLGSSSYDWVSLGPGKSFAHLLHDAGFEVWMPNARGTIYSRKHRTLTADRSPYWQFSWHEIGYYDLPAAIDYVSKNGSTLVHYVGHSQGGTSIMVLLSSRPKYNSRLASLNLMAPAVFMGNAKLLLKGPGLFSKQLTKVYFTAAGMFKLPSFPKLRTREGYNSCRNDDGSLTYFCKTLLYFINGSPSELWNMTFLPIEISHLPSTFSLLQAMHFAQLMQSERFCQYDHGREGNLKRYGQKDPPEYPLNLVTAPTCLQYAEKDVMVAADDIRILRKALRSVVVFRRVPHPEFNHIDFLFAINASDYAYDTALRFIESYDT